MRLGRTSLIAGGLLLPALIMYTGLTASPAVLSEREVLVDGMLRNRTVSSFWSFDVWGSIRGNTYCEPLQLRGAIQEPINAWSNIGYVVLGALTIGLACKDACGRHKPDVHTIQAHPWFACLMGLTWVCLGFFSFLFHGAHVSVFHRLDIGFTNSTAAALVAWSLLGLAYRVRPPISRRVQPWTVAMAAALVLTDAMFIVYKYEMNAMIVLSTLVALVIFIEVIVQPLWCGKTRRQFGLTATGVLSMLFSFLLRNAEVSWGKPLCLYSTWFQPHALWHLMSAVAIACQVASWRSPFPAMRPGSCIVPSSSAANVAMAQNAIPEVRKPP